MQHTILAVTLVLMAILAFLFVKSAMAVSMAAQNTTNVERRRKTIVWTMLAFGAVISIASLREWPHALASGPGVVEVNARSSQWFWDIDRREVPAGATVQFNVHADDVNHGFGVVDDTGRLLFQTQAMPGYVNSVSHVFEKTGTYRVICMELCGVGHHAMTDEFQVVAGQNRN